MLGVLYEGYVENNLLILLRNSLWTDDLQLLHMKTRRTVTFTTYG